MRTRACIGAVMALLPLAVQADNAVEKVETEVRVEAHAGYFTEHCLDLVAGQILEYGMQAPYVMDFNLHYHGPQATTFPVAQQQAREKSGRVSIRDSGHHCFMWTNREQRESSYSVQLRYRISAAESSDQAR